MVEEAHVVSKVNMWYAIYQVSAHVLYMWKVIGVVEEVVLWAYPGTQLPYYMQGALNQKRLRGRLL